MKINYRNLLTELYDFIDMEYHCFLHPHQLVRFTESFTGWGFLERYVSIMNRIAY